MGGTKITRTSWSENIKVNIGEQEKIGENDHRKWWEKTRNQMREIFTLCSWNQIV